MNYLIVGAGAIGGYFGGRLVESGQDVTFLVREHRQQQLAQNGLVIESVHGNFRSQVRTMTMNDAPQTYDIILIALKAYQLDAAIETLSQYMHEKTLILPLLNGYQHYDTLFHRFGKERVLGGLCFVESTLNETGAVVQTSPRHDIVFGGWDGNEDERIQRLSDCFTPIRCNTTLSDYIQEDIWKKYIFIASMSGITSLFRSPIGPILQHPDSNHIYRTLIQEISAIASMKFNGLPQNVAEMTYATSEALSGTMKSSMQRDMEKGLPTEGEHLQGYLLKLAVEQDFPILRAVYSNVMIYEMLKR